MTFKFQMFLICFSLYLFLVPDLIAGTDGNSKKVGTVKNSIHKPAAVELIADESNLKQSMDGIGANTYAFPFAGSSGWKWESVKYIFDEIDIPYIRLASWFSSWETENDNSNPDDLDLQSEVFDPDLIIRNHDMKFAKFMQERDIELMLGIWGAADWLTALNEDGKKIIPPEKYDELGESIAAYLKFMRQNGVDFDLTEVQNEPDINAAVRYADARHLQQAAVELIRQLDKHGLEKVMIHGPNLHSPSNCAEWGSVFFDNPTVKKHSMAVSYHTWWSDDPAQYKAIKEFAAEEKMPVWATEVGYCALKKGCTLNGKQHYLRPETWETAWDYAMSYYRAIDWSGASRVYHWALLGHNAIVGKNGEKLPSYYIFKQFANYIPPGSVYTGSSAEDENILSMLFKLPDNTFSAIIINKAEKEKQIVLKPKTGAKKYKASEIVTSVENSYERHIDAENDNAGHLVFAVPGKSITSLKFEK